MALQGLFFKLQSVSNDGYVSFKSTSGSVYTEQAENLVKRSILEHFSDKDALKIAQVAKQHDDQIQIDSSNRLIVTFSHYWAWFPFLVAFFIGFLLIAIPISPKKIEILGFTQPGGILIFPLTFMVIDILSELFGYRVVRRVIWSAATVLVTSSALLYLSLQLTNLVPVNIVDDYQTVFAKLPYLLIINAICLLAADFTNAVLFARLKGWMQGQKLWLRSILSTCSGQIVYTIVWISLFYIEKLGSLQTWQFMAENFVFKVGYAAMMIPITYCVIWLIRRRNFKFSRELAAN